MEKLKDVLGLMPEAKAALAAGARARVSALKTLRKKLEKEELHAGVEEIDAELELWKGTTETKGLFWVLDVDESQQGEPDPLQRDLDDKPDYRTHSLKTSEVSELVASEISGRPPVEAIRILNGLEDGEKEREPSSRDSVLTVIRDARRPLVEKVGKNGTAKLQAVN